MHRFAPGTNPVPVRAVVFGAAVILAIVIVLVYWLYRRGKRNELEPARRNSLKVPRRPSIYVLPIIKPLPWDTKCNRICRPVPGKAVPIGFIVVDQEQKQSNQCHWKYSPCQTGEF